MAQAIHSSIPLSAQIFDKAGLLVTTVGEDAKAALKPVKVARDLGTPLEIASGLSPQDRVIESTPDGVGNGDTALVANTDKASGSTPSPRFGARSPLGSSVDPYVAAVGCSAKT
jgi:hypothetical protein